jgi:diguanylate cyclase (GGDEF)-like protein
MIRPSAGALGRSVQRRPGMALPTVLIIDRDPASAAVLELLLETEYAIVVASSGAQAIEVVSDVRPDLILLDVIMPDMDGYSLCEHFKADPATSSIPIIFITGLQETALESHGLELGAADYVTRPFSASVVRARVRNNVELKRARDRLLGLADTDYLTGISNRRAFDDAMEREWKRLARSRAPLAVIILDIDDFKAFNDNYGHVSGDDCLHRIGGVLAAHMQRPADLAARYGGEEFVCLLPETAIDAGADLAERVRAAIAALAIPHRGSRAGPVVTASFGVASDTCTAHTDGKGVLLRADACLYRAKRDGRNRVSTQN